ncbi:hypothetical protein HME01_32100 [Vreelandella aquamarina]|nr:hypothetical protein HME01_32100 [Halomonas meridiana]
MQGSSIRVIGHPPLPPEPFEGTVVERKEIDRMVILSDIGQERPFRGTDTDCQFMRLAILIRTRWNN